MALNTTPCNRYLHLSVAYSTNHNPATTSANCQGSKQTYLLHNAENCQSNSYSRLIKFLQAVVEHGTNQIIISCAGWCPLILLSFSWNSQVVQDFAWPERSCFPLLWEKSYCACKVPTGFFLMATPALAICSILEFLYLPTLPPLGSLEAAKSQIPVPEKTVTAVFAYKLFTTLHLMVCKFQILPPNIDLP